MRIEYETVGEMLSGFFSTVRERLSSPLIPSFIIAWSTWNYRVIMMIFSDEPVYAKFAEIDQLLNEGTYLSEFLARDSIYLSNVILIPLVFALLYIFIYLPISIYINRFVYLIQARIRAMKQRIDGEKLITKDQRLKLEEKISKQESDHDVLRQNIRDLEATNEGHVKQRVAAQTRSDEHVQQISSLEAEKVGMQGKLGSVDIRDVSDAQSIFEIEVLKTLPNNPRNPINEQNLLSILSQTKANMRHRKMFYPLLF